MSALALRHPNIGQSPHGHKQPFFVECLSIPGVVQLSFLGSILRSAAIDRAGPGARPGGLNGADA